MSSSDCTDRTTSTHHRLDELTDEVLADVFGSFSLSKDKEDDSSAGYGGKCWVCQNYRYIG